MLQQLLSNYLNDISNLNLTPLKSFSNQVWKISNTQGEFVLRQYSNLGYSDIYNLNVNIKELIRKKIPIPEIIKNKFGELVTREQDKIFDLSEYINHEPYRYPEMNIDIVHIRQSASLLAFIHQIPSIDLPKSIPIKYIGETNFHYTLELLQRFDKEFDYIFTKADKFSQAKLFILRELIFLTHERRTEIAKKKNIFSKQLPLSITHGDFSLSNLLLSPNGKLFIVDWENFGIRYRAWELHRSILLICGKGTCNANFDEIDFSRASIFMEEYLKHIDFTKCEFETLPYIADYIANIHWLKFTIESLLRGDYRILERIPDTITDGLWWLNNHNAYTEWLCSLSKFK